MNKKETKRLSDKKKYEVIIDYESLHLEIEAENKEEAKRKVNK